MPCDAYAITEVCPEDHGNPEERIAATLKAGKAMGQRKLPRTGDVSAGTYSLRRSLPEERGPSRPLSKDVELRRGRSVWEAVAHAMGVGGHGQGLSIEVGAKANST